MYRTQRKLYSQNFLHSRKLVKKLVDRVFIAKNDLILEIGPGKGIITQELVEKAGQVIAVEIDVHWHKYLVNKFTNQTNLTVYQADILTFKLPQLPYKVFANLPFSIEGKIIRRLLESDNPPSESHMVVMQKLAERLRAAKNENLFSTLHKPWFEFVITHQFRRTDFTPIPKVDAVLLRFSRKLQPELSWSKRAEYQKFVMRGYGQGLAVQKNLSRYYPINQINQTFQECSLNYKTKPGQLTMHQWVKLYKSVKH